MPLADGQEPRQISPAQFAGAAECDPDAPAEPLPRETNARVMRAFAAFQTDFRLRLGRARRPRNTLARRYVSRQLNLGQAAYGDDARGCAADRLSLRRVYQGDLTPAAGKRAGRDSPARGWRAKALVTRLEALRERFRLNPPDDSDQAQTGGAAGRAHRVLRRAHLSACLGCGTSTRCASGSATWCTLCRRASRFHFAARSRHVTKGIKGKSVRCFWEPDMIFEAR